jgi:cytochrome c oxidase subunit 4
MSDEKNYVFLNGKPVEHPHESHHHVSPMWLYMAVFGSLLVLTGITYLVSYMNLGPASLPVAMLVATVKATLVVAFFMHLKYEDKTFLFMFLCGILFVGIFFTVTLTDMAWTDELNEEAGIEYYRSVHDRAEDLATP